MSSSYAQSYSAGSSTPSTLIVQAADCDFSTDVAVISSGGVPGGPGGGNGWLMTTIDAGSAAKRYAVTGECKDDEPTRYEIRDAHGAIDCELTLDDVAFWTAACEPVDAFADVTAQIGRAHV